MRTAAVVSSSGTIGYGEPYEEAHSSTKT